MSRMSLSELSRLLDATLVGPDAAFDGVSTDTRTLCSGELFVALHGPNFDGHSYLETAHTRGAAGAMVDHSDKASLPTVAVDDTRLGLGRLAQQWRLRCPATIVAITGSNGKTTLKEMTAAILAKRGSAMATLGNLNNDIGVPLTLCRLRDEAFAVIEMGANHAGEIAYLTGLVQPDVAVLNNAGRAHLEGFGSLEAVARAKAEIIEGLGADGTFVYNADDRFAPLWREMSAHCRQRSFGTSLAADVRSPQDQYQVVWKNAAFEARFPVIVGQEQIEISLQLAGEHNRMNALAAITASLAAGAALADASPALARLGPVPGRLCLLEGIEGARVIDDSYNANPDSVVAALKVLSAAPGRRTLVLGDLGELGKESGELHRQLGERCSAAGIDRLFTVGTLSEATGRDFGGSHQHFADRRQLIDVLLDDLSADDSLLIKGSRTARMDEVVDALRHSEWVDESC